MNTEKRSNYKAQMSRIVFVIWILTFEWVAVFLSSCAQYGETEAPIPKEELPATGPAILDVSPWAVEVAGSGDTQIVFVKVMDRDKNPIPDVPVYAKVEDPSVATIDEKAVTDKKGLARFVVTGIGMPSYSQIVFTAGSASTKIYVWKRGWGPYGRD
ncbi:MAG TPA: hypothetical protein ACFYD3_07260 [Candidatus Hypogeohydataceae bacterium YC41]